MTFTCHSGESESFNDFTALLRSGRRYCTSTSSAPLAHGAMDGVINCNVPKQQRQLLSQLKESRPSSAAAAPSSPPAEFDLKVQMANRHRDEELSQAMTVAWRSVFAPIAPMLVKIAAPSGVEPSAGSNNTHTFSHQPFVTRSPKNGTTVAKKSTHSPNPSVSEGAAGPKPLQSLLRERRRLNAASSATERSTTSSSYSASNGASFHLVESPHSSPPSSSSSRFFLDTATSGTLSPSPATAADVVAGAPLASPRAPTSAMELGMGPATRAGDGAVVPRAISKLRSESRATLDGVPAAPLAPSVRRPFTSMSRSPSVVAPSVSENALVRASARSFSYEEGQAIPGASDSRHHSGGYGMASCLHRIAAAVEASVEEDARVARRRADAANAAAGSARSLHHDLSRVRWGCL